MNEAQKALQELQNAGLASDPRAAEKHWLLPGMKVVEFGDGSSLFFNWSTREWKATA